MVEMSTIFAIVRYIITMTKERKTTETPAVGCMLGTAYQKLLGQLAAELARAGLDITTGEYLILRALYSHDGLQQCEIADMVGKDKSAVSRCVAAMERKGLVVTQPVSHKCLRVYLSARGHDIKPRVMDVAETRHKALLELTAPHELEIFTKILKNIITH